MKKKAVRKSKPKSELALVVTTEHRGVFFGYTDNPDARPVVLRRARMCVYWSSDIRGILGLGSTGPSRNCKIGPAVPKLTPEKVTAVIECTDEAAKAWEAAPWG